MFSNICPTKKKIYIYIYVSGRALVQSEKVWLALWGTAKERFDIVMEVARKRGVLLIYPILAGVK